MSYSSTGNPPNLISPAKLAPANAVGSTGMAQGGSLWMYNTTDPSTVVRASGYFSDALARGMRNGDVVISVHHTAEGSSGHSLSVSIISEISTAGAANCSTSGLLSTLSTA